MTSQEAFRKLDDVREEFQTAGFALRQTLRAFDRDHAVRQSGLNEQVTLHHLKTCLQNIEVTYLVRLFAEFEDILRDYWLRGRKRQTNPRMIDLMNRISAYCFMSADDVLYAHEVREYRNAVVHDRLHDPRYDFQICRSRLARFVRWLPRQW